MPWCMFIHNEREPRLLLIASASKRIAVVIQEDTLYPAPWINSKMVNFAVYVSLQH